MSKRHIAPKAVSYTGDADSAAGVLTGGATRQPIIDQAGALQRTVRLLDEAGPLPHEC